MSKRTLASADTPDLTFDQQLAQVNRERMNLNAELDSLPGREQILLETDASDDAFVSLDRVRRRAEIGLSKLDVRERAILQQARQQHDAQLADTWAVDRARYQQAADTYIAAVRHAQQLEQDLHALALEVNATGAGRIVPQPIRVLADLALAAFEQAVAAMPGEAHIAPPETDQYALLLLDRYRMFNPGDIALMTAASGWLLVDKRVARWAPGTKPPLRPIATATAPKSFRTGV